MGEVIQIVMFDAERFKKAHAENQAKLDSIFDEIFGPGFSAREKQIIANRNRPKVYRQNPLKYR